jgi:hypothetical protein
VKGSASVLTFTSCTAFPVLQHASNTLSLTSPPHRKFMKVRQTWLLKSMYDNRKVLCLCESVCKRVCVPICVSLCLSVCVSVYFPSCVHVFVSSHLSILLFLSSLQLVTPQLLLITRTLVMIVTNPKDTCSRTFACTCLCHKSEVTLVLENCHMCYKNVCAACDF